jgi:cell division protein FtsZ
MISLGTNGKMATPTLPVTGVRVIGVGGAGLSVMERIAASSPGPVSCLALHTDAKALLSSSAPEKIQLGRESAKGLGTGGDPALGQAAARECAAEIRSACDGAGLAVVCAGLGGGTGSGAAPVVAQEAQKSGALVIGLVTLPFEGEGAARRAQAEAALGRLGRHCVAVLCFENDRMREVSSVDKPLAEAFAATGEVMAEAVRAIIRMVGLPSLMHVGIDELVHLFRGAEARSHFGHAAASGPDRAREAVEAALRNPLLDGGRLLAHTGNVLVHISGDESVSLAEMQTVLRHLTRHVDDDSQIHLGVGLDDGADEFLAVTILAARHVGERAGEEEDVLEEESEVPADSPEAEKSKKPAKKSGKKTSPGQTQEELPLDQAMRGRFKDLDPTMVDGQDLDIPAFIRMRIRLK